MAAKKIRTRKVVKKGEAPAAASKEIPTVIDTPINEEMPSEMAAQAEGMAEYGGAREGAGVVESEKQIELDEDGDPIEEMPSGQTGQPEENEGSGDDDGDGQPDGEGLEATFVQAVGNTQERKLAVQASLSELDPGKVLESALFMSGQPVGSAELAKLVGIAAIGFVETKLEGLAKEYKERDSALEIVREENGKWTMRVRATYAPAVRNFAGEAEISKHAIKTLAYISRNEGIKKRDLFMRLGSAIYTDVAELVEKGFVNATPAGRTVSLKTTAKFKQYFER